MDLRRVRRRDGRTADQLRPLSLELGLLSSVDGSARLSCGDTRVLVGVRGPCPVRFAHLEDPERALLEVHVAPASGTPGPAEAELCALLRQALSSIIVLSAHPRTVISISVHVASDDGSGAAAALNATVAALVDAGVPLRTLLGAVCIGRVLAQHEESSVGGVLLDLTAQEGVLGGAGEEAGGVSISARALVAFTAQELAGAREEAGGGGEGDEGAPDAAAADTDTDTAAAAPLVLTSSGPLPLPHLEELVAAAAPACRAVIAFLRLALREKVVREAVNWEPSLGISLEALVAAR